MPSLAFTALPRITENYCIRRKTTNNTFPTLRARSPCPASQVTANRRVQYVLLLDIDSPFV